jgi:hypothetical protein
MREFNFRAYQKTDRRNQPDFLNLVNVRTAMLQIDGSHNPPAAEQRDGEKGFVTILGQFMEELESRILCRLFADRHRFVMFRHPARNALPHAQFEPVHNVGMSVPGSAQDQVLALEHIDEAGIALHQRRGKLHHPAQHFVESAGGRQPATNLMQQINGRVFD